jgi:hypothetical protein
MDEMFGSGKKTENNNEIQALEIIDMAEIARLSYVRKCTFKVTMSVKLQEP